MFLVAAKTLARQISQADLETGALYPLLTDIRGLSVNIAKAVIDYAYIAGLAQRQPRPAIIEDYWLDYMYDPTC